MQNMTTMEYTLLFNALTDAEETLQQLSRRLIAVQQQAEELFLQRGEETALYCVCPANGVK